MYWPEAVNVSLVSWEYPHPDLNHAKQDHFGLNDFYWDFEHTKKKYKDKYNLQ